jgi:hypothetical protein
LQYKKQESCQQGYWQEAGGCAAAGNGRLCKSRNGAIGQNRPAGFYAVWTGFNLYPANNANSLFTSWYLYNGFS